jgi:hypothetical protein
MRKRTFQPRKTPRCHSQKLFPFHSVRNVDNSTTVSRVLLFALAGLREASYRIQLTFRRPPAALQGVQKRYDNKICANDSLAMK